jgi:peroxiredoxin
MIVGVMNRRPALERCLEAVFARLSCLLAMTLLLFPLAFQAAQKAIWSEQEKPIVKRIDELRGLPDDVRALATKQLALEIRQLPAGLSKVQLSNRLANLSTEGDFGSDTLQTVTDTLAGALRETPVAPDHGKPALAYIELAELVRYEHVVVSLSDPQFAVAMSAIERVYLQRQHADFVLTDLQGNRWNLKQLRGKVVLVNFWATWCPPCRKEIPDLEALYNRFQGRGLIILGISDEDAGKVKSFIANQKVNYPILLDPGRKVNERFEVRGIPKSFIYDRDGKLASQSIDMRTQKQFLNMLAQAGLR